MTRQDLRNRYPEFRGECFLPAPRPKARRALKLSTVLKALGILVLLALLWEASPSRLFPEYPRGTDVPRHCVD